MNIQKNVIESVYISAGCNRCDKALDWGGKHNQLIYAQSRSVALLTQQEPFQIKYTFNTHKDKVNCVKWISRVNVEENEENQVNEFVSGSEDKSITIWRENSQSMV